MNKQQGGFTLIELVVVIVLLGILAATAVPRFAAVSDDARTAVAQGVYGSILSSAVIQLAAGSGTAATFATIVGQTDVVSDDTVEVSLDGGTTLEDVNGAIAQTCAVGSDDALRVEVGGSTNFYSGALPDELCDG